MIWGPRPPQIGRAAAAMLRGSQVCSALQPPAAAWVWPSATPPQRWAKCADEPMKKRKELGQPKNIKPLFGKLNPALLKI